MDRRSSPDHRVAVHGAGEAAEIHLEVLPVDVPGDLRGPKLVAGRRVGEVRARRMGVRQDKGAGVFALEHHPDVLEAAVFGVPSEEWGESVHAVVVVREGATVTEDQGIDHAREHLAGYKIPRSVTWCPELPKTGSGKVLKRDLRAPFWAGRASKV